MTALGPATSPAPARTLRYSFITLLDPSDSSLPCQRKAVRSHAASYQHYHEKKTSLSHSAKKKRRRKPRHVSVVPGELIFALARQPRSSTNEALDSCGPFEQITHRTTGCPSPWMLGQGRVDPFRTYPIPWEPFIPELVDHYLTNMAIDLPELDEPEKPGLLRTRWFPLVMTEAATFQVIILLAASHHASLQQTKEHAPNLLHLKSKAISLIRSALPADGPSDQLVGAVAKMASYEAMFGDQTSYEDHMNGLTKMIRLRGGLSSLGLNGMLARICVWIDRNSALLHNSHLHFTSVPGDLSTQVNPSGFLAFSGQSVRLMEASVISA